MTVDLVWDAATGVGECPTWDAHNHRLLFADIPAGRIHGFTPATGARATWQLPELLGSFGLCRSGRLIVALRHRVVFYDPVTREITALTDAVDEPASNRLNDGKVAPDGSFIATYPEEVDPATLVDALKAATNKTAPSSDVK